MYLYLHSQAIFGMPSQHVYTSKLSAPSICFHLLVLLPGYIDFLHSCLPVSAVWDQPYLNAGQSDLEGHQEVQYIYWKHFPCWCPAWIDCMEIKAC